VDRLEMGMNIYRKKLLNSVLFFAKNTKYLNLTKISKLLYFLDFTHFEKTGYPSIGLDYYAFPRGPVPRDFWAEIKDCNVPEDFKGKLALILKKGDYKEVEIRAIKQPELSVFTPREIKILEDLAFIFKEARGKDITEVSHLPKEPWEMTIKNAGKNKLIDYMLGFDENSGIDPDDAKESLTEYFETQRNFNLCPTQ
jgi:uncharacterized phage-associated protein